MDKPSLLILSFSDLYRDARLLKQINLFKDDYNVTTCGYGPQPVEGVEHIEVPLNQGMWNLNGRLITAKLYNQVLHCTGQRLRHRAHWDPVEADGGRTC